MTAGISGEDVHDQFGTIDHTQFRLFLDVATLSRRDGIIDDDQPRFQVAGHLAQFFQFSLADIGARMRAIALLQNGRSDANSCGVGESSDLCHRVDRCQMQGRIPGQQRLEDHRHLPVIVGGVRQ